MPPQHLPPAQPAYVLRGHAAQVHALNFTHDNSRVLTGDAEGWIISWSLAYKRPVAVWKAHHGAILGLTCWSQDCIITHGRDNKLIVWKISTEDENDMDTTLPIENQGEVAKQPWLLHILDVNTLNFCSFAMCYDAASSRDIVSREVDIVRPYPILIAVPNTIDSGGVDILQLPSENRVSVIKADKSINTGMVMALDLHPKQNELQVIAGYESGHTMVFSQKSRGAVWQKVYSAQPHTQPVLSLAMPPLQDYYITSSADAILAKHPLPFSNSTFHEDMKPLNVLQTKHSGQQGLQIRSDGKIFATAGWDARVRVYSAKTMKELAVLKWHKEGCYATAFAGIIDSSGDREGDFGKTAEPETSDNLGVSLARLGPTVTTVEQRRDQKAQSTHWLAAGSKDGKISLWDVY